MTRRALPIVGWTILLGVAHFLPVGDASRQRWGAHLDRAVDHWLAGMRGVD